MEKTDSQCFIIIYHSICVTLWYNVMKSTEFDFNKSNYISIFNANLECLKIEIRHKSMEQNIQIAIETMIFWNTLILTWRYLKRWKNLYFSQRKKTLIKSHMYYRPPTRVITYIYIYNNFPVRFEYRALYTHIRTRAFYEKK